MKKIVCLAALVGAALFALAAAPAAEAGSCPTVGAVVGSGYGHAGVGFSRGYNYNNVNIGLFAVPFQQIVSTVALAVPTYQSPAVVAAPAPAAAAAVVAAPTVLAAAPVVVQEVVQEVVEANYGGLSGFSLGYQNEVVEVLLPSGQHVYKSRSGIGRGERELARAIRNALK